MKIFQIHIYKHLIIYFIVIIINTFYAICKFNSIYIVIIESFAIAVLLFFAIVPYFYFSHLIVDANTQKIIFRRERFLLKKKEKSYNINSISYTYDYKYAGFPSKEKVLIIYNNGKKQIVIRGTDVGYRLLDDFVNEFNRIKNI